MSGKHPSDGYSWQPVPVDPDAESAFDELVIRTAYWCVFGPLMPAAFAARFREHAATMPLRHARQDLAHCLSQHPDRRFA